MQNQGRPQQNFQSNYQGYRGGQQGSNQPYGWRQQNSNPSFVNSFNYSFAGPNNRNPQQQAQLDRLSKMEDILTQFMQASMIN